MPLLVEQELLRIHFVAHGMNYLLTYGTLTPCQSFARNCSLIFKSSANFYRTYLIFIMSLE